jgi:hypothetical protein
MPLYSAFCRSLPVALALVLLVCSEMRNDTGAISKKIGEIVHSPGAKELDLRTIPTFSWEYFYVSKPGATREEMCKLIGAGRND